MTSSITYYEMEYRSFAVLAKTAKTSSALRTKKPTVVTNVILLWDLITLGYLVRHLLKLFHRPDAVRNRLLETATPEQLESLAARMEFSHSRTAQIICRFNGIKGEFPGHSAALEELERRNEEFGALLAAIRSDESVAILVSARDQERIIRSLLDPEPPNEELVSAFRRYHV
jgi:hypothetical protein